MDAAVHTILAFVCALSLLMAAMHFLHLSHMRRLARLSPPRPAEWPLVSVIIAARDEAAHTRAALATRLADDYPNLEVIFVDDRSTDGTGDEARLAAASDPRVRVIRIDELPKGWLGKVNALAVGTDAARGEWLLYSDADVQVKSGALRTAVSYALAEGLDMVALLPEFRTDSFGVDVVWAAFLRIQSIAMDPARVRDPRAKAAIGSGAFNLVRRTALDRTPGFEHLRMETGDDAALGQMVKQAGGRLDFVDGFGSARVAMYESVSGYLHGIEKNGSTMADKPFAAVALGMAGLLLVEWTPLIALGIAIAGGPVWLLALSSIAAAATTASYVTALWANTRSWLAALCWPAGIFLLTFGLVRSTWLAHRRGGVVWRQTFYSLEELHEGRRYNL